MMEPWHGFVGRAYPTPRSICGRGWARPPSKGFCRINKLKEKIIYFYCLSVNVNDNTIARPSPAMIVKTALFIADSGPP
jgi:hypothetical protein